MARLKWDWFKARSQEQDSGLQTVPVQVVFPDGEPDQMPEVYWTYRQYQAWNNQLWCEGALEDQPHILMMEFMTCRAAEREWEDVEMKPLYEWHILPKRQKEEQEAALWRQRMGL